MSASKIEWTDRSDWNPVRGCTRVSPGCGGPGDNGGCYAEAMAARFSKPGMWGHGFAEMKAGKPRWTGKVELQEDRLLMPLSWRKPARVFPNSTSDFFHEALPDTAIDKLFAVMSLTPHLTYQVLTKRAHRMLDYFATRERVDRINGAIWSLLGTPIGSKIKHGGNWRISPPILNCWLGVSVERQQEADERRDSLCALAEQGWTTFCSYEPALGPVDWSGWEFLSWLISGGESGPQARPSHPDWHRATRDWCGVHGVAYLFKQWGEWAPNIGAVDGWSLGDNPEISRFDHREWEDGQWGEVFRPMWCNFQDGNYDEAQCVSRIGKKAAGRLLDGIEHSAFPEARP